jgi:pimeloyl-ACP methyl ester carboxylesterase
MPFVSVGSAELEYRLIGGDTSKHRTIVMLHEGLGSVAMWRDFPGRLARTTGCPVLVYSRLGYGRSRPLIGRRTVDYMHTEALVTLPRMLDTLEIEAPVLFGHSDGASIALLHAGSSGRATTGVIAMAPHVFVEEISISSIAAARVAYEQTDLRMRLARYHDDVDGAFWGWNDVWLDRRFRDWNIESCLAGIRCPVLLIQGLQDEYGTLDQLARISRQATRVQTLELPNCRHAPHRDQGDAVLSRVKAWLEQELPLDRERLAIR